MSQSAVNYKSVLEDLRNKRSKLDVAISAIEEMVGESHPVPPWEVPVAANHAPSAPRVPTNGIYSNKTIAASAIHFLHLSGSPQSTGVIVEALKRGGISSQSKNLYRTLYNTLNSRVDKDILKEGKKWGLVEWVPK
jgi:hypothetical protein